MMDIWHFWFGVVLGADMGIYAAWYFIVKTIPLKAEEKL